MAESKDAYVKDFNDYMAARAEMENDAPLKAMLQEYDACVKALTELLEEADYDAQKAILLTNDIEYLGAQINLNPIYLRVKDAFAKLQGYACSHDCSTCTKSCDARDEE
ncbi:MAG: hypothetical protein Q4C04_03295 [Clostridia bacterium]|nr:hypothetical protein [Clostridia bacterium]